MGKLLRLVAILWINEPLNQFFFTKSFIQKRIINLMPFSFIFFVILTQKRTSHSYQSFWIQKNSSKGLSSNILYLFCLKVQNIIIMERARNKYPIKQSKTNILIDQDYDLSHLKVKGRRSELRDYQLMETIGVGGFGVVKKAFHLLTGQIVAVKICTIEGNYQLEESIQLEIEQQRTLMHEAIAQIYEVIREAGKIYIFMEFCPNGELFDRVNRNGPLPQRQSAKIFHQILSALIYIKQNGLSHRDIKPENILFDENMNAKLIDFGFACRSQSKNLNTTICGTPSYTPPEIIKRTNYDAELVDVWSLSVTLYAMLTAQLPFEGSNAEQRKKNILAYKITSNSVLSTKVRKLFNSVFIEAKYRARLVDLQRCDFLLQYDFQAPSFIDLRTQSPQIEEHILNSLSKDTNVKLINNSVMNCRLDRNRALYYLTLKKMRNNPEIALNNFKKKRRSSTIRLTSLSKTPSLSKEKNKVIAEDYLSLKTGLTCELYKRSTQKKQIVLSKFKRRSQNPDSPRRLLDCVGAYNQF